MIKNILIYLVATLVIFEEWLWDALALAGQHLSRLLHLEKFDHLLMQASPNYALLSLIVPLIIVTPFNIFVLFLFAHGAILQAILLEIAIKLFSTLLIARIFRLVKPALLTFNWFAKIHDCIAAVLLWAKELVRNTSFYQRSLKFKADLKAWLQIIISAK